VGVTLAGGHRDAVAALDGDLRAAARAIGVSLGPELARLRPALAPAAGDGREPDAELTALDLDRDGEPDALTLAACLAAHDEYVTRAGRAGGVSLGALALGRLLVWASRAALLSGRPPRIRFIGPPRRAPEAGPGELLLSAHCAATVAGEARQARAVAVVGAPG
jgi:hypothetical protein